MNIATDKEQSARLVCFGLSVYTADMSYVEIIESAEDNRWYNIKLMVLPFTEAMECYKGSNITPAWSLSALLALIPKEIYGGEPNDLYYFSLAQEYAFKTDYCASYKFAWDCSEKELISKTSHDPIEACVQLLEWLMVNNYTIDKDEHED